MHTTNLYPTPPHLVRLGAMVELGKAFPDAVIGLSDHTTDNVACLGAVALGASILERHFTDHMFRQGPDIVCSMDEKRVPRADRVERQAAQRARRHQGSCEGRAGDDGLRVCDRRDDCADQGGRDADKKNLWVKRPGTGSIPAEQYEALLGKRALRDLPADVHLELSDID